MTGRTGRPEVGRSVRIDNPSRYNGRWERWLAICAAVATYTVLVLGALQSRSGAGLACPEWPLCRGSLLATFSTEVLIASGHRVAGMLAFLLALATAIVIWRRPASSRVLRIISVIVLGLFLVEGTAGAVVVLAGANAPSVSAHLGIALLSLAVQVCLVAIMFVPAHSHMDSAHPALADPLTRGSLATVGLAFILLTTGASMARAGARLWRIRCVWRVDAVMADLRATGFDPPARRGRRCGDRVFADRPSVEEKTRPARGCGGGQHHCRTDAGADRHRRPGFDPVLDARRRRSPRGHGRSHLGSADPDDRLPGDRETRLGQQTWRRPASAADQPQRLPCVDQASDRGPASGDDFGRDGRCRGWLAVVVDDHLDDDRRRFLGRRRRGAQSIP